MPTLDERNIKNLLTARVEGRMTNCSSIENRFKSPEGLYCWRGIVTQSGGNNCVIASVCDPLSYTQARSRFCATFQRYSGAKRKLCEIGAFAADPNDPSPPNKRGGILVNNNIKSCKGAAGFLSCIMMGTKQSLADFKRDPSRAKGAIISVVAMTIALVVIARYYRSHRKQFPKLK